VNALSRPAAPAERRSRWPASAPGLEMAVAAAVLGLFVLVALAAPLLAPYDPHAFSGQPLERPGPAHWLGTNDAGQDILSELLYGARVSLAVGLGAALGTVALGLLVGAAAGYLGGAADAVLMRLVDVMLILPRLPLLILLAAFLGSGLPQTVAIISLLFWPATARVIRAQVQSQRARGYVRMARHFGAGPGYVLRRHILPAIAPLVAFGLVAAAGRAVAMEAGLAFLGLGDPTAKSWGLMMRYALDLPGLLLTNRWLWWLLPPGLCLTLLILALTYAGMGLERRLDPRLARR
jgi:peptide/nickel transport system permease protein